MKTCRGKDIKKLFTEDAIVICADRTYAIPEMSWLGRRFANFYWEILRQWDLYDWRKNWDCDNFAVAYWMLASVCHGQSKDQRAEGIAVGKLHYVKDDGGRHVINCAVNEDGEVVFIEPQSLEEVCLSEQEQESIWFVEF